MNRVLFLTEIGEGIGFGHLSRCSPIAKELSKDYKVEFFLYEIGNNSFDAKFSDSILVKKINWISFDSKYFNPNDFVIVDSYMAKQDFFDELKLTTSNILVFDDYCRLNYKTKFILNPNVSGDISKYDISESKIFSGRKYVILREEFRNLKKREPKFRVKNIVISVGGSDYRGLLPILIKDVCSQFSNIYFHIITGSDSYKNKLEKEFEKSNLLFYGFLDSQEIVEVFIISDMAISACGQTLSELIMTSTPFVTFILDTDQIPIQEFYLDNNIIEKNICWDDKGFCEIINQEITRLMSVNKRKEFLEKSYVLFDGKGVDRICSIIKNAINEI